MTTTLSNNELTVLDENLDLFSDSSATPKPTKPRRRKKPRQTTNSKNESKVRATAAKPLPIATEKATCSPPNTRSKLLAVRAKNSADALSKLGAKGSRVIDYAMEKRDPALKNFALALLDQGLEFRQDKQLLYWTLIDDERTTQDIENWEFVELAITQSWFEEEKRKIRELKGIAYIDACTKLARASHTKSP
ncbi:MAG: hypothetical protein ACRBBW_05710 [Cellvibrionaceae bacterium]